MNTEEELTSIFGSLIKCKIVIEVSSWCYYRISTPDGETYAGTGSSIFVAAKQALDRAKNAVVDRAASYLRTKLNSKSDYCFTQNQIGSWIIKDVDNHRSAEGKTLPRALDVAVKKWGGRIQRAVNDPKNWIVLEMCHLLPDVTPITLYSIEEALRLQKLFEADGNQPPEKLLRNFIKRKRHAKAIHKNEFEL